MIPIINGFDLKKSTPIDPKQSVVDQTARLAIQYPYKGLHVRQNDTGQIFRYITTTPVDGSIPTNVLGDWELVPTVFSESGVPATSKGVVGDIYIDETNYIVYKKTGVSTWTSLFSISGSKVYAVVGVPSSGLGVDGDMAVRDNGDVYTKASGSWSLQFNIAGTDGQSDTYASASTTSIDLATATAPLNVTIETGKSYTTGQVVIVASRADNDNNLTGSVVSYNSGTGELVLDSLTLNGTGTHTDWDVNLSGAPGTIGKAFYHVEADISLNDAKVIAIEAGVWTKANPYTASIGNDIRTSLLVPVQLTGSKTGHSISYDGTNWYDNGLWRGPQGPTGGVGTAGPPGPPGAPGAAGIIPFTVLGAVPVIENLSRGWYYIDLLTNVGVIIGGNCAVGTLLTLTRTTEGVDGPVPPDSSYTSTILKNSASSLNYKGRYVTSIPVSARNITFINVANTGGVSYWKCIGEDVATVIKSASPLVTGSGIGNLLTGLTTSYNSPSNTFGANEYTVPKIDCSFSVFRDTGSESVLTVKIQSSDDGTTWTDRKTYTLYAYGSRVTTHNISWIDKDLIAGTSKLYRFTIGATLQIRVLLNPDIMLYSILR